MAWRFPCASLQPSSGQQRANSEFWLMGLRACWRRTSSSLCIVGLVFHLQNSSLFGILMDDGMFSTTPLIWRTMEESRMGDWNRQWMFSFAGRASAAFACTSVSTASRFLVHFWSLPFAFLSSPSPFPFVFLNRFPGSLSFIFSLPHRRSTNATTPAPNRRTSTPRSMPYGSSVIIRARR